MCNAGRTWLSGGEFHPGGLDCGIGKVWQLLLSCTDEVWGEDQKGDDRLSESSGRPPVRHAERLQCCSCRDGRLWMPKREVQRRQQHLKSLGRQQGGFLVVVSLCGNKGEQETTAELAGTEGRPRPKRES